MQSAVELALESPISVWRPFAHLHKHEVLQLGLHLPLGLSQSCLQPNLPYGDDGSVEHCGQCNKCEERQTAFTQARIKDPTIYASNPVPLRR
jgi:7-cyano-7-deazaguanine synthase